MIPPWSAFVVDADSLARLVTERDRFAEALREIAQCWKKPGGRNHADSIARAALAETRATSSVPPTLDPAARGSEG